MSVQATIAALQTLHRSIPGVVSASIVYVGSIDSSSLPLVLTWPEQGEWERPMASAPIRQDRFYRVQCFVAPISGGASIDDGMQAAITLLQRFGETYCNPDHIQLGNGSTQIVLKTGAGNISDSGVGVLEYAGVAYHGFEFKIGVYEKGTY